MSDAKDQSQQMDEQLELLRARFEKAGVDRRTLLKIMGAAMAGTAVVGGVPRYVGTAKASPATGPIRPIRAQSGEEQVFYNRQLVDEPSSQDFNLNLYCNGEVVLWSGLLGYDQDLNPIPDWAEEMPTPNEDASVWTFKIRKDNKGWSNGDPVTASDFAWSWERQLNPANAAAYAGFLFDIKNAEAYNLGTPIADEGGDATPGAATPGASPAATRPATAADLGIKVIDDWTLEVTMQGPRGYFPQVVAYTAAVPAHRASVEQYGDKWALGDVPLVSNGPFKLDQWEHQVKMVMSKNEGYWNAEAISITRLVDPIIPTSGHILAYESGSGDNRLDWIIVGATDLKRYQDDPVLSTQLQPYVYPGIWMLNSSNGQPPFDNLNVRLALNHAIDRDRLVNLTNQLVSPAFCMVPPGVFGYLDDPKFEENLKFDPDAAKALLVGTPYEGGTNWPAITMHLRGGEEDLNSNIMANDIAEQLKETLGMNIDLEVIPEANWRPRLFENTFQLIWIRWWYDYPDPNNGYGDMFYSRKASGKRQAWSNEQFDDLVNKARGETDPDARLATYSQCEEIIQSDGGYMPVVYRQDQVAYKPWVKNVPVNKQGFWVPQSNIYIGLPMAVSIEGRTE